MKNILRIVSYSLGGLGAGIAIIPFVPSVFTQIGAAIQQQQAATEAQLAKAAIERKEELKQFTFEAKKKTLDVATCNTNCSNLQSRQFQTRIICNYNYASARINCN